MTDEYWTGAVFSRPGKNNPLFDFQNRLNYGISSQAGVVELVDAVDSKSTGGNPLGVRVSPPAPKKIRRLLP